MPDYKVGAIVFWDAGSKPAMVKTLFLADFGVPNTLINDPHWRIRKDTVDLRGHVTLRYLGKLRQLNVGWSYRGQSICLYVLDDVVTFATEDGEFIGETRLDPIATTNPKVKDFSDNLHRLSCSR